MTLWLVDGMNVIGSRPDGWWRDRQGAQRRLVERLSAFAAREGEPVAVVFDGAPWRVDAAALAPTLEVAFATRRGRDAADADIAERVARAGEPAALRVVTSDRALAERVRALGAEVVAARGFRERLEEE